MKAKVKTTTPLTDQQQVTEHIEKLPAELRGVVQYLREVILASDQHIAERIKWNNPSFYYSGEMKPFDPKEYKREIAVFNLFKGRIMLVFPSGARVNNSTGFLEGDYKDGRRITVFNNLDDAKAKQNSLQKVIRDWVDSVDK